MAGFQSCPGIVQTVVWAKLGDEKCLTMMHWRLIAGVIDAGNLYNLALVLAFNWYNRVITQLPANYVASEVVATLLTLPNDLTRSVGFFGTEGIGGNPTPQLSNNVSLAIQHNTGLSGRSARGRTFWPVFATDDVVENNVLQLRVDLILEAFNLMRNDLISNGWQPVVLSRWAAKALRPVGIAFDVAGYTVKDTVIDSMRRRLPGRGA